MPTLAATLLNLLQIASIAISFFALVVYTVFLRHSFVIPKGCFFMATGFLLNAVQKITGFREFPWWSYWRFALDSGLLPFMESLCYAIGAILLLTQKIRLQSEIQDTLCYRNQ